MTVPTLGLTRSKSWVGLSGGAPVSGYSRFTNNVESDFLGLPKLHPPGLFMFQQREFPSGRFRDGPRKRPDAFGTDQVPSTLSESGASSEFGTCKTVKARFWPWLSGKSPYNGPSSLGSGPGRGVRSWGCRRRRACPKGPKAKARFWPWLSG